MKDLSWFVELVFFVARVLEQNSGWLSHITWFDLLVCNIQYNQQ